MVSVPVILATPVDCDIPPVKPVPVGANHVYVVPEGTVPLVLFEGVTAKDAPLLIVFVIAVIDATGLIVTVRLNGVPAQLPEVGVTEYVAVSTVLPVFTSVPLILVDIPDIPPLIPELAAGASQLKLVPAGTVPLRISVGVMVNNTPLQVVVVS